MKTYIKYLTLGLLSGTVFLTVACNNNFRAAKSKAPGAAEAGKFNVTFPTGEEPGPEVDGMESPEATYTMALIDQVDSDNTFAIQGELNRTLEDAKAFRFVNTEWESSEALVYVVRIAPNGASGGSSRDFAFFFDEGPNGRESLGTLYVEHQDIDNYLMKIPNVQIPDMSVLSSEIGVSKETLLKIFAAHVFELQPSIYQQGIAQPEASDLPDTLVADWFEYMRTNEGSF